MLKKKKKKKSRQQEFQLAAGEKQPELLKAASWFWLDVRHADAFLVFATKRRGPKQPNYSLL